MSNVCDFKKNNLDRFGAGHNENAINVMKSL